MSNVQKERGKYFENKVAKTIREAFKLKKFECRRAMSSGNSEFEFGDIFFNNPETFPYVFECKYGYGWDFSTFFPEVHKNVFKFMEEAFYAGEKYKLKMGVDPELICVVLSKPHYKNLAIVTKKLDIDTPIIIPNNKFIFKKVEHPVYIYLFDDILVQMMEWRNNDV